jgi:hypothetical protein
MKTSLIFMLVLAPICSCSTKSAIDRGSQNENNFKLLLAGLKSLENGYTYDMETQDTEGCYIPDKNGDSLFYNPSFPILGKITSDSIYALIHFEPGDDMYPVIRTFNQKGEAIDSATVVYGNCAGWDCDFDDCEEKFKIIDQNTIEDVIILTTTPCDSMGQKASGPTERQTWKKMTTIDKRGKLVTQEIMNEQF